MSIRPYLNFDGNTREAVLYYASVFGLEEPQMMTFGSMHGAELPPGSENLIMHTQLNIGGSIVMFSDMMPGMPFAPGNNFSLAMVSDDEAALKAAFDKLKQGGSIVMELQETPWTKCYGYLVDKYGIGWQFNYEQQ